MIVGDPSTLAIESQITEAYQSPGQRALGCFVLHVAGCRFGVWSPDATLLACSFDAVQRRVMRRGSHVVPFGEGHDALEIAGVFRDSIYAAEQTGWMFLGMNQAQVAEMFTAREIQWAPDGDAAFDDGSFVLQMDIRDQVRLIAFRTTEYGAPELPSLREAFLSADRFYETLEAWERAFLSEWQEALAQKPVDGDRQARRGS